MRKKETKPSVFESIDQKRAPALVEEQVELPDTEGKKILRFLTREEKMQEASKPLYLKRYE